MPVVTYLGNSYSCATAIKSTDYIHLLDDAGALIIAFDNVKNFDAFTISSGSWTNACDPNHVNESLVGTYSHSYSNKTHYFTGCSRSNGKSLITAGYTAGDKFVVNGKTVPAYRGVDPVDELPAGRWVSFIYDGTQLNFNGGSGVSTGKLNATTAGPEHVLAGRTFYSGDKTLKTGSLTQWTNAAGYTDAEDTLVVIGNYVSYKVPAGIYSSGTDGGPFVRATKAQVADAIGLTANKLAAGSSVLGITGSAGGSIALILYAEYLPRGTDGSGSQTVNKTVGYYNPTYFDSSGKCVKAGTYHASYFAKCAAEGSGTVATAKAVIGSKTFTTTKGSVGAEQASNISLSVGATPTCQVSVTYNGTGSDNRAVAVLTVMAKV